MKVINRFKFYIFVLAVSVAVIPSAYANFNLTLEDIELQAGITADINVTVFESTTSQCTNIDINDLNQRTIFAVHGVNSDANVFGPLALALFNNNPTGGTICRVAAVEMPGHGLSGLPEGGLLFGQMTEDNYANVVINTLDRLSGDEGIRPAAIMTHSNGGIVTSLVQQKLADSGTNILERFGIGKITFMAPPPTAPVAWPSAEETRDILVFQEDCLRQGAFMAGDPCEILDVVGPPGIITWADIQALDPINTMFDCDPLTVPIGVPTIMSVPLNCVDPPANPLGDHTPIGTLGGPAPESLTVARQAFGVPPQQRPVTQQGIFAGVENGTFSVISFEEDVVVGPPSVTEAFFDHLSGPSETNKFQVVGGPNSNHVMFFIAPEEMLQAVAGNICFIPIENRNVPTLGEWGLIAMAGLLGIVGFIVVRRRQFSA